MSTTEVSQHFYNMETQTNVYPLGERRDTGDMSCDEYSVKNCGDFVFQKTESKNMDILWRHFYSKESYPEFYLGITKKMAICKCPITGEEQRFNGDRCLSVENPEKGSTVTVTLNIKTRIYSRDFIFCGWVKNPVHEWRMTKGTTLQLEQNFVDGLLPQDRRYLKMTL